MTAVSPLHPVLKKIAARLPKTFGPDRYALGRELNRLRSAAGKAIPSEKMERDVEKLAHKITASVQKRRNRMESRPKLTDFPDLPITAKKDEIIRAIRENPVVIISGETGSGKTTQIPKFCLAAGRGIDGLIGCTQPRRIAAISVANRIAEEIGEPIGQSVGFKIRFHEKTSPEAYIKIMTDGILLAETQADQRLKAYDTLIIDEAHERSLNIDFILGFLKTLLKKRKDLKLIITSATIDTEKFSAAFDDAPIIEVSGRSYPVEIRYDPLPEDEEITHVEKAVITVDRLMAETRRGDILIFMPTEGDIRETIELLSGRDYRGVTLLPLFARLSAADQSRVFSNPVGRKIIVATNIAETSLTIPGIKFVVDTGLARISQYNPRSRTTGLPVSAVSKSSADQRAGRCGRVENGVCIRLFSEEEYAGRPRFTKPEILRANLAEVILRMMMLGLGDIAQFPFLDMPPDVSIQDGFNLLQELGAIRLSPEKPQNAERSPFELTEKGRIMACIPIDPRLSCMLIEAEAENCLKEIQVIVAALSVQDPRERPAEKAAEADRAHAAFKDPSSDFLTLLTIWKRTHDIWEKQNKTQDVAKFCKENYLSFRRMREWRDIHGQLTRIPEESGISGRNLSMLAAPTPLAAPSGGPGEFVPLYEKIHKSILSGYLSGIAMKKEGNLYQAAKNRLVMIFPGSGLFNKGKSWIVAAEMVETSRLFARTVAQIDPAWIELIAKDRCKYTYLHPHWERTRGNVVATEQVSLFGLIIVSDRTVLYGRINPAHASEIFIQSALVDGDLRRPLPFMQHNATLIESVQEMENKMRRRDLLIGAAELFQFYKERIGDVYDIRTLERRIRSRGNDTFLRLHMADLLRYTPDDQALSLYPDKIRIDNTAFSCEYQFEPGSQTDGVTIRIPAAVSGTVSADALDWLVPGLYREKIAALIKNLPKAYRKRLVPVSDTVEIIIAEMPKTEEGILQALGEFIHRRFGVDIPAAAWAEEQLPDHLRMRIAITGPTGNEIASARDKSILHKGFEEKAGADEFAAAKAKFEKPGITRWELADLPESIPFKGKAGREGVAFPAFVPDESGGPHVNLRLFLYKHEAASAHELGVQRLYTLHFAKDLKMLKRMIALTGAAAAKASYFGGEKKIQVQIIESVTRTLFKRNLRSRDAFDAHAALISTQMVAIAQERLDALLPILDAVHETRNTLFALESSGGVNHPSAPILAEIRTALDAIAPQDLLLRFGHDRWAHLPRYIRALGVRALRGVENPERDLRRAQEVARFSNWLKRMQDALPPTVSEKKSAALTDFFWLLEEFKVSVFAQELKTAVPISAKRLEHKIKEIERMV